MTDEVTKGTAYADTSQQLKKKHATGRPKKAVKRSEFLMVRLTPAERMVISERSKRAGIKPSEWFRRSAKNAKVYPRFTAEESGWFRMLSGLANNLNQLTRLANAGGLFSIAIKCAAMLKQIGELVDNICKQEH